MGYMETYKAWCENEYFDEDTRAELKSIAGDEKEIEDSLNGLKGSYRWLLKLISQ